MRTTDITKSITIEAQTIESGKKATIAEINGISSDIGHQVVALTALITGVESETPFNSFVAIYRDKAEGHLVAASSLKLPEKVAIPVAIGGDDNRIGEEFADTTYVVELGSGEGGGEIAISGGALTATW